VQILLNALTATSVLALVAVGLYIVYGLVGVINMAHGEMLTIGAYTAVVVVGAGVPFWLAVAAAVVVAAAVGLVLEAVVLRFLYGVAGLATLLATWGVSIALQQAVRLHFGPSGQYIDAPVNSTVVLFGESYPVYRLVLLAIAVCVLAGVIYTLTRTRVGVEIRATMDDRDKAELMGINTRRVFRGAVVVGTAIAGLAGALLAPITAVTPLMGLDYVVQSFLVVMVGGVESVLAPLAGATLVGGFASVATNYVGATLAQILVLLVVALAVYFRPNGLVGRAGE
jgi:branched-chain amino acid transport system permease protein/urea transport system permease protein